jgi:hypothetical protein
MKTYESVINEKDYSRNAFLIGKIFGFFLALQKYIFALNCG